MLTAKMLSKKKQTNFVKSMSVKQPVKSKKSSATPSLILDKRMSQKHGGSCSTTPRSPHTPRKSLNISNETNDTTVVTRRSFSSPKLPKSPKSPKSPQPWRQSIVSPHLVEVEIESQILTNTIREYVFNEAEEEPEINIWEKMLLSCNVDVTGAVIQYLLRQELPYDEKQLNSIMLLSFYNEHSRLPNLINFSIERDIYLKYDDINAYSPYTLLYKFMLGYTQKYYFTQFSSLYQKKANKIKDGVLDNEKSGKAEKKLAIYKSILDDVVSIMVDSSIVPIYIQYTWSTIHRLLFRSNPGVVMKNMFINMFVIPFNDLIEELMKVVSTQQLDILLNVSKCFHEMLTSSTKTNPNPFWKEWILKNCKDLKKKLVDYANQMAVCSFLKFNCVKLTIKDFYCDDSEVVMDLPQKLEVSLVEYLERDWESLYGYLSEEGYKMIEIHMTSQLELKQRILYLIQQINQLRVNTFNENQNYLQKMSEMKMRMKDLYEERRYLRQIMFPEEEERINEEESHSTP